MGQQGQFQQGLSGRFPQAQQQPLQRPAVIGNNSFIPGSVQHRQVQQAQRQRANAFGAPGQAGFGVSSTPGAQSFVDLTQGANPNMIQQLLAGQGGGGIGAEGFQNVNNRIGGALRDLTARPQTTSQRSTPGAGAFGRSLQDQSGLGSGGLSKLGGGIGNRK